MTPTTEMGRGRKGVDPWAEAAPTAPAPATSITATSDAKTAELSAWEEAFRPGQMRERLRSAGFDASVRTIARETSSSAAGSAISYTSATRFPIQTCSC